MRGQWIRRIFAVLSLICAAACSQVLGTAFPDNGPPDDPADAAAPQQAPGSVVPASASAPAGRQTAAAANHPANRLAKESSPYLLLHAHNPVDWYPWGPEAFERAKRENKPVFLSVGYSTCFWCHVMERRVFSNEEIAAYMNAHFVNIKVDREERPDIDDLYMQALNVYFQAAGSTQSGGWPMSLFLTPEGQPIAGGTYFPPADEQGRPGFMTVLKHIDALWLQRHDDVIRTAGILAREVQRQSRPGLALQPVPLSQDLVTGAIRALQASFDSEYGGVDFDPRHPDGPKFPVPTKLALLQSQSGHDPDGQWAQIVDTTLDRLAAGGIHDHLGGGFHRYSTDRQWLVPHFEKMLYDNAQLADLYVDAFRRTSRRADQRMAEDILDFLLREMCDPQGGFYSALDAETDGVEGRYYVWTRPEIEKLLGTNSRLFLEAYGFNRPQTFEAGYVLYLPRPIPEVADALQMPVSELDTRLTAMRAELLRARSQRQPVLRDDKVLTAWNGLAIRALARGGKFLQRRDYLAAAEKAAYFVVGEMRDDSGVLLRSWRGGQSKVSGYLDDYACLIDGLLTLHEMTGDEKWLNAAQRLTDDQIRLFWDSTDGAFFYTGQHQEQLLARTKDAYDSVLPSGNSVSVRNLVRLSRLTGQQRYRDHARQTLEVFAPRLQESPASMANMAAGLAEYLVAFGNDTNSGGAPGGELFTGPVAAPPPRSAPPRANTPEQPLVAVAVATPEDARKHDKLAAKVYLSVDRLAAGETCRAAVVVDLADGWHINSNPARPADVAIPTEVTLTSDRGTTLEDVSYPAGHDFLVDGFDEPLSVYEKQVVLYGRLSVPVAAAGSTESLEFVLRYQACNNKSCGLPKNLKLRGTIPVAPAGAFAQPANRQLFEKPAVNEPAAQ